MSPLVRISALSLIMLCGCATESPTPSSPYSPATASPQRQSAPDSARVYADLIGRSEDFSRVVRSPKEFEGKSVVLYGTRNGSLRAMEGRFSMPLAATDGKTVISAVERPASNQLYLMMPDDFAREARERKMLPAGGRAPVFVECKLSSQTIGRTVSYPCEVVTLAVIGGDRISDSLWRARDQKLEYHHY